MDFQSDFRYDVLGVRRALQIELSVTLTNDLDLERVKVTKITLNSFRTTTGWIFNLISSTITLA